VASSSPSSGYLQAAGKKRSGQCVPEPTNDDPGRERQIIEAALAESGAEFTVLTDLQRLFELASM
jgi:hypothetical protein